MAAKKPVNWWLWTKVLAGGALVSVGGPAFTMWLTPTEEELRAKYNPELRKKSLENREEKQQEFDDFVTKLKQYSKSDKPIWVVVKEEEERRKQKELAATKAFKKETDTRRDEIRREAGLEVK
ncbi:Fc.00g039980.m01.CDS01 [Cosmosporella sp. VM-42]